MMDNNNSSKVEENEHMDGETLEALIKKLEECRYRQSSALTLPILEMFDILKKYPHTRERLAILLLTHQFSEDKGFHTEPVKQKIMKDLENFVGELFSK
jgi:hypothetical protein